MSITAPVPGASVSGTWTSNVSAFLNGFVNTGSANASSTLTTTTTQTDVPGLSVTVTIAGANAFVLVSASVDVKCTTAQSGAFCTTQLLADTVVQTGTIQFGMSTLNNEGNVSRVWKLNASAGSHTYKIQSASSGTSVANVFSTFSNLTVIVFDVP